MDTGYSNDVAMKPTSSSLRPITPVSNSSNWRDTLATCSRSPRGRDPVGHLRVRALALDVGLFLHRVIFRPYGIAFQRFSLSPPPRLCNRHQCSTVLNGCIPCAVR